MVCCSSVARLGLEHIGLQSCLTSTALTSLIWYTSTALKNKNPRCRAGGFWRSEALIGEGRQWRPGSNGRSLSHLGSQLEFTSHDLQAFVHAHQPKVTGLDQRL